MHLDQNPQFAICKSLFTIIYRVIDIYTYIVYLYFYLTMYMSFVTLSTIVCVPSNYVYAQCADIHSTRMSIYNVYDAIFFDIHMQSNSVIRKYG